MALHGCSSSSTTDHFLFGVVSFGCVFDPSWLEGLFLPYQGPGQSMCALVLRGVVSRGRQANLRRGHLPSTCGACRLLGLIPPASRGPSLSWDSRRAPTSLRQTSSTAMPVWSRASGSWVTSSRRWHVTSAPVVVTLAPVVIVPDVFDDSIMDSFHIVLAAVSEVAWTKVLLSY